LILVREPILVINAGSSSCKFSIFETKPDRSLSPGPHGQVDGIGAKTGVSPRIEAADAQGRRLTNESISGNDHKSAMAAIHRWFAAHAGSEAGLAGVGHRVVHGGLDYSAPVLIDDKIMAALEALVPLAPLHQPHNIAAIRAIAAVAPTVPQVACFDTAFHRSEPPLVQEFALPRELTAKGVRRYGFHGLSYEYIVSALPLIVPECAYSKVIVAHLGNGASMCAIAAGRSVATTMGFSVVDGLPMGTRTGTLDPGVILYLLEHEGMNAQEIQQLTTSVPGFLAFPANQVTCEPCSQATVRRQRRRSIFSSIASVANSVHWRRRSEGSMLSFSLPASASTRPRFERACAPMPGGSVSPSMSSPTIKAARAFRSPPQKFQCGLYRPMRI
jgi:acetate kinase